MRKISKFATVLITSLVLVLAGLAASPIATAAEDEKKAEVSLVYKGSNIALTSSQKEQLKDAVETVGKKASFTVKARFANAQVRTTDSTWQARDYAYRRGQEILGYLASLGIKVSKISVDVEVVPYQQDKNPASYVTGTSGVVKKPVVKKQESQLIGDFETGSTLSDSQKTFIRREVLRVGADGTFIVFGRAGKSPNVEDRLVVGLAQKRGEAVRAYLVTLGVKKSSVTIIASALDGRPNTSLLGTAKPPVVVAVAAPAPAPAPPLTCATGGTCIVGDRGPGGGIVFYVSAANFTSTGSTCNTACKYLEVAPSTWRDIETAINPIYTTVGPDVAKQWASNTAATGQVTTILVSPATQSGFTGEQENWKIGRGFNNTSLMRVSLATSEAQAAVLAYAGNVTAGQWFVPSMNELNELCKFARGQTTGGLTVPCVTGSGTLKTGMANDLEGYVSSIYLSSSEYATVDTSAWGQSFTDGGQSHGSKSATDRLVRPIRAF